MGLLNMTDMNNQGIEKSLYSLAHLTLIGATPAELVYIAARAGYDAVSPRFIPCLLYTSPSPRDPL